MIKESEGFSPGWGTFNVRERFKHRRRRAWIDSTRKLDNAYYDFSESLGFYLHRNLGAKEKVKESFYFKVFLLGGKGKNLKGNYNKTL